MSLQDKEQIETRFGPLWSGKTEVAFRGGVRTFRDVKRALDLAERSIGGINLARMVEFFSRSPHPGEPRWLAEGGPFRLAELK